MVQRLCELVAEYEQRLREMSFVPKSSYGRRVLREYGEPNRMFITFLYSDHAVAIQFLKDVGLLRSNVQC